jgi:hypothetical protein
MKTTSLLKSTLVVILFLGACVNISAEYVKDPTLCDYLCVDWDSSTRKFTVRRLHGNIQEPYCEWHTDTTWTAGTFDILTSWDGITPGATTYTTARLDTKWGDPWKGGNNGASNLFVAIKHVNNLDKGVKSDDCYREYHSLYFESYCGQCDLYPHYCDNYVATFSGSNIYVSGINNCSNDNMFMIATSDHSKWQTVSIKVDPTDPDKGSADVSAIQFYNTNENVYPYAKGVMFYMSSDDKGVGISGQGPNYCSKSFTPPITNSISDIIANNITISPNPATPSETITIQGEYALDAKVSIISVSGAMVGSVIPSVGADAMAVSISGLNLQAGIYFIRIESGEKVFSGKLCVK